MKGRLYLVDNIRLDIIDNNYIICYFKYIFKSAHERNGAGKRNKRCIKQGKLINYEQSIDDDRNKCNGKE